MAAEASGYNQIIARSGPFANRRTAFLFFGKAMHQNNNFVLIHRLPTYHEKNSKWGMIEYILFTGDQELTAELERISMHSRLQAFFKFTGVDFEKALIIGRRIIPLGEDEGFPDEGFYLEEWGQFTSESVKINTLLLRKIGNPIWLEVKPISPISEIYGVSSVGNVFGSSGQRIEMESYMGKFRGLWKFRQEQRGGRKKEEEWKAYERHYIDPTYDRKQLRKAYIASYPEGERKRAANRYDKHMHDFRKANNLT